jgi:hypothetical protein
MIKKLYIMAILAFIIISANQTSLCINNSQDYQPYLDYAGDKMLNYDYMVDQKDSDQDGLPDYEEINKYCTDPNKPDTDGDGILDGDWNERTEYAYTITARRELKSPFNAASLRDTFEDIKIISDTKDKLIYDCVLYLMPKTMSKETRAGKVIKITPPLPTF